MAKQTKLYLPTGINNGSVKFTSADGTTAKTLFTAGTNDSNVKSIVVHSDDTTARNIVLNRVNTGITYPIGTVNIPITAGATGSIASVDLINSTLIPGLPLDSTGKPYLPLKTGDTLTVAPLVAVTAAKTITITSFGEDF